MKPHHGLTLIELVTALAILALLTWLGVAFLQPMMVANRLTSQTNELLAAYQTARAEAIRLNRPVRLCRAANATAVACAGGAQAAWAHWIIVRPDNNDIIKRGEIRPNLVVRASSNLTNDIIVIRSDGLPVNTGGSALTGTLQVCAATANPAENARRIRIELSRAVVERASLGAGGCANAPGNN
ncbi:GspH/FimT family pseudopilin [Tepidicella xavieri]|jgi:type IV fimbrial biogenesis protein FimT|uniref:Type II secretion system protein H n=1 Tax=Tepidicella xavieri TaxID=360241 RepID=A0A4R6UIU1_9BURK|nr:GspH/FimT family pseudopilin [Tepidicella xavieri]TDQ45319.1 type IV fimbrial biogenesis protein FimT [Tepidicella xavieri]